VTVDRALSRTGPSELLVHLLSTIPSPTSSLHAVRANFLLIILYVFNNVQTYSANIIHKLVYSLGKAHNAIVQCLSY